MCVFCYAFVVVVLSVAHLKARGAVERRYVVLDGEQQGLPVVVHLVAVEEDVVAGEDGAVTEEEEEDEQSVRAGGREGSACACREGFTLCLHHYEFMSYDFMSY